MTEPVFLGPGEAEGPSSPIGGDILYLARGEQTGERIFAFENVIPPGQGRRCTSTPIRPRRCTCWRESCVSRSRAS